MIATNFIKELKLVKLDLLAFFSTENCRQCKSPVENDFFRGLKTGSALQKHLDKLDTIFNTETIRFSKYRAEAFSKKVEFYKAYTNHSPFTSICLSCAELLAQNPGQRFLIEFGNQKIEGFAAGHYEDRIANLIIKLKYDDDRVIAEDLAHFLFISILQDNISIAPDSVFVPVPLHWKRKRKRGFNQASLIANKLGKIFSIKTHSNILERIKDTKPLYELDARARVETLEGAFKCRINPDPKLNYILIDDLSTTGTTIANCAMALKNNGAKSVKALVVANRMLTRNRS